jgi:hypothetical protein
VSNFKDRGMTHAIVRVDDRNGVVGEMRAGAFIGLAVRPLHEGKHRSVQFQIEKREKRSTQMLRKL